MELPNPQKIFLEAEISLPKTMASQLESFLLNCGAIGCYEILYREGVSNLSQDFTTLMAYFPTDFPAKAVVELSLALWGVSCAQVHWREVCYQDYVKEFQKSFSAFLCGKKIWVVPPWDKDNPKIPKNALCLILEPGLAFGTGKHATTQLLVEWLEENAPNRKSLLDLGCGSGILALSAALLGVPMVQGVDVEILAVSSARENAKRNEKALAGKKVEFFVDDFRFLANKNFIGFTELFVANIFPQVFYQNKTYLNQYLKNAKAWALSGIPVEKEREFCEFLQSLGFTFQLKEKEGWLLVSSN